MAFLSKAYFYALLNSNQDTLDKLNGLSYMPCTAKLDLLSALAEAGANPVKSCLQVSIAMKHFSLQLERVVSKPNPQAPCCMLTCRLLMLKTVL